MCGITGIWNFDGRAVSAEEARRFNNTLQHRGPDDEGYYSDASAGLTLGHRRLSILDLSPAGHQPMKATNGNYVIVYNGEIYNFLEIRLELESFGHVFRSNSDTEVVIAAFEQWGPECLLKFNGMWGIAIWDTRQRRLFLARDRFGIKPLYFRYARNKEFCFSSETISFRSLSGSPRDIDPTNLSACLSNVFSLEGNGRTIFKGIEQLKQGHWAWVT